MLKFSLACLATFSVATKLEVSKMRKMLRGRGYHGKTAAEKFTIALNALKEVQESAPYDYEISDFFKVNANTFTCDGNDQLHGRKKLIHQQGTVAPVRYEPVGDHPYTGFFASGSDYAILRLSESGFIVDGYESSKPSLALKFFSTGVESANIVMMIDWNNQNTLNFFPKDDEGNFKPFTTQPPLPTDQCSIQTHLRKTVEANAFPLFSGVSSTAIRNTDGGTRGGPENDISGARFPFEMQFIPNEAAIPVYEDGTHPMDYLSSISVVEGEPLFKAYARENPDSDLQHIGNLWLEEDMFRSLFGDTQLFFEHDTFTKDIVRTRKAGEPGKGTKWTSTIRKKKNSMPPKWNNTEVPEMPGDMTPKEVIEGGILGTLGEQGFTGCPFAWMLLQ